MDAAGQHSDDHLHMQNSSKTAQFVFRRQKRCSLMTAFHHNPVADLVLFSGGDFGNPTRTEGVWVYGRILVYL